MRESYDHFFGSNLNEIIKYVAKRIAYNEFENAKESKEDFHEFGIGYIGDPVVYADMQKSNNVLNMLDGNLEQLFHSFGGDIGYCNPKMVFVEPFNQMVRDNRVVLGDRSPDMATELEQNLFLSTADYMKKLNVVLCHEMIHYIKYPQHFFRGLIDKIKHNGLLLLVTRPSKNIGFPFGRHARKKWEEGYSIGCSAEEVCALLNELGYFVQQEILDFPVKVSKDDWLNITYGLRRNHSYLSNIRSLSDEQIAEDVYEIQKQYVNQSHISFIDRQICISATNPSAKQYSRPPKVELAALFD